MKQCAQCKEYNLDSAQKCENCGNYLGEINESTAVIAPVKNSNEVINTEELSIVPDQKNTIESSPSNNSMVILEIENNEDLDGVILPDQPLEESGKKAEEFVSQIQNQPSDLLQIELEKTESETILVEPVTQKRSTPIEIQTGKSSQRSKLILFTGIIIIFIVFIFFISRLKQTPEFMVTKDAKNNGDIIEKSNTNSKSSESDTPTPIEPKIITPISQIERRINSLDGAIEILIPQGSFQMGLTEEQYQYLLDLCPECNTTAMRNSMPQHTVYVDEFWIYQTEVTNAMYRRCVDAGYCGSPEKLNSTTRQNYYNEQKFEYYPVTWVTWEDADNYCHWIGGRLPTEAEWEKAARSEDGRLFPWGNKIDDDLSNIDNLLGDTSEVATYPDDISPYWIYDMAGNVYEWVYDWYEFNYYLHSSVSNPTGPDNSITEERGIRGGYWGGYRVFASSAFRGYLDAKKSNAGTGFRCVFNSEDKTNEGSPSAIPLSITNSDLTASSPTPVKCPGMLTSRVKIGDKAQVCTREDRLIIREEPTMNGQERLRIMTGTRITILDGPECRDNSTWWKIKTENGIVGWVREGTDSKDPYFICPVK